MSRSVGVNRGLYSAFVLERGVVESFRGVGSPRRKRAGTSIALGSVYVLYDNHVIDEDGARTGLKPPLTRPPKTRVPTPISRVQLWHEVVLPVQSDGSHSSRTETFIGILDDNPAIAPYVRSLVLHPGEPLVGNWEVNVPFKRAAFATLSARLPALRFLRLRDLVMPCLYEVVIFVRDLPTLEALYLDNVHQPETGLDGEMGWPQQHVPPAAGSIWKLRTLSLSGGAMHGAEVIRLANFLVWAREYLPALDSLDFCCYMMSSDAGGTMVAPGIPSFGPSLLHFGTLLYDLETDMIICAEGRESSYLTAPRTRAFYWQTDSLSPSAGKHVESIMSSLPRCGALQSLSLHYDCRQAYMARMFPTPQPSTPPATSFFLERLADVLSTAPGAAPLPLIESISLMFYSPIAWLSGFETAFARLAEALVGDADGSTGAGQGTGARRYPRFSHLHVRISIIELVRILLGDKGVEEERRRQEVERVDLVLPMLAGFVRAGVDVEVVCD
ncbi:hypothetical protein TRAPUB_4996 [Trametes pubescens]|uniref:Uncharacterized protein n=1 Tax=Trametes pubescens TaxID=154538 RepID=A0A1M2V9P7_TRAPU|nr:hypothetical protein TRAPUB_4996 [Trametes pubescens]